LFKNAGTFFCNGGAWEDDEGGGFVVVTAVDGAIDLNILGVSS